MTTPLLKIKVFPKPVIKGKMDVRFPPSVDVVAPITLDRTGANFVFSLDVDATVEAVTPGILDLVTPLFQPIENVDQPITSGSTATVGASSATVRVNKTVGGAITLTLPLAALKTVPVLIADWKGDAGTNNITINPSGSETIQGLSSWTIAGDNGSVYLRPIKGVGYAI